MSTSGTSNLVSCSNNIFAKGGLAGSLITLAGALLICSALNNHPFLISAIAITSIGGTILVGSWVTSEILDWKAKKLEGKEISNLFLEWLGKSAF